ncbi:uncharacterized protein LOC120715825 isoform X2 [Simochromis diagramma]|uniref:uncharacterized protein LOC120715825 isoform X2 n=1 Tax=Simochromis diagramma TaxID=43689 RepID=UPI001A7E9E8B|nr:uncharacterized protein LOC120715825 isoform X2 [Simochromis diagramma]
MADTGVELDRLVAAVPQNPDEQQKDDKLAQTLLFVLLTVVLYGIAAQAFFINLLYHRELAVSRLNNRSEQDEPIRGFAHLTGGSVQENEVMLWHINNLTVLSGMAYKDGPGGPRGLVLLLTHLLSPITKQTQMQQVATRS